MLFEIFFDFVNFNEVLIKYNVVLQAMWQP